MQAAKATLSQLKRLARALWSNPPTHGARIAAEVVGDAGMFEQWKGEVSAYGATDPTCVVVLELQSGHKGGLTPFE